AVQAAKAGVLEVGDVLCVTKGDLPGAERTVAELEAAQRDGGLAATPVLRTSALAGEGVDELVEALSALRAERAAAGSARLQVREIVVDTLRRRVDGVLGEDLLDAVARGEVDPYAAADRLLTTLDAPADPGAVPGGTGAGA
ncbi:MAG: hypothetical protein R6T85_12830, partial [Egibacteraceae bacterium]